MKNLITFSLVLFSLLTVSDLFAQQMGVNTETPNASAILDVTSTDKGILVPRMPAFNRPAGVNGLMLYNTTDNEFNFFENGSWKPRSNWKLTPGGHLIASSAPSVPRALAIGDLTDATYWLHVKKNVDLIGVFHSTTIGSHIGIQTDVHALTVGLSSAGNGDFEVGYSSSPSSPNSNYMKIERLDTGGELTVLNQEGGIVPCGGIIMWSGSSVPAGWALCNGANGTPNLQNRFIQGGTTGQVGQTGGSASSAHTHSIDPPNTVTTTDGAHAHTVDIGAFNAAVQTGNGGTAAINPGAGASNISVNPPNTSSTTDGAHSHKVDIAAFTSGGASNTENRPPFYVLAFIMKKCN